MCATYADMKQGIKMNKTLCQAIIHVVFNVQKEIQQSLWFCLVFQLDLVVFLNFYGRIFIRWRIWFLDLTLFLQVSDWPHSQYLSDSFFLSIQK